MNKLKLKFHCKGSISLGPSQDIYRASVTPSEVSYDLYLDTPKKRYFIKSIHSLKGFVEIQSPEAALNFTRLITSPKTHTTIALSSNKKRRLELIDFSSISEDIFFGDIAQMNSIKLNFRNGRDGFIQKGSGYDQFIIMPKIIYSSNYFKIKRCILIEEGDYSEKIHLIEEVVSKNGEYKIKTEKFLLDCKKDLNAFIKYE